MKYASMNITASCLDNINDQQQTNKKKNKGSEHRPTNSEKKNLKVSKLQFAHTEPQFFTREAQYLVSPI